MRLLNPHNSNLDRLLVVTYSQEKLLTPNFHMAILILVSQAQSPLTRAKRFFLPFAPFCRPIENAGAAQFYMAPPGLPLSLLHYFFTFNLL